MASVALQERKHTSPPEPVLKGKRTNPATNVCLENQQEVIAALKACSRAGNLEWGKQVHAQYGEDCNIYVANALINMYAKCKSMADASQLFDSLKNQTVVSWTTLILGYADNGQGHQALDLFFKMRDRNYTPNSVTFVAALKACTSLAVKNDSGEVQCTHRGKEIHNIAVENGCNADVYVQSTLVDMYSKSGNMEDARLVFDGLKYPTVVTWNVLILGYVHNGQGYTAMDMFTRMRIEGTVPDSVTIVAALKACTSIAVTGECWDMGKQIHNLAVANGCYLDVYVQSTLVDLYAKCGSMVDAHQVFDGIENPTVVSWNALILGYADNGQGGTALDMFNRMRTRTEGLVTDTVTFVAISKACSLLAVKGASRLGLCRDRGKATHSISVETGSNLDIYVQSTLVKMYAKLGSMTDACSIFDGMKRPDAVSWTAMILGYIDNGQGHAALDLFNRMKTDGHAPDSVTYGAALKACALVGALEFGRTIHSEIDSNWDIRVANALINMYAKCGRMAEATQVFDSLKYPTVVSWNVLTLGYADNGEGRTGLDLFTKMRIKGFSPNSLTFVAALKACIALAERNRWVECMNKGQIIHNITVQNGYNSDAHVQSSLIDMYRKCGSMVYAHEVFDQMEHPDVVSWNVLILGYTENGQSHIALEMFTRMRYEGPTPDSVTFGASLKACSLVGAVEYGRTIHSEIDSGKDLDVDLVTCLVDFYAKCGSLVEAQTVFNVHAKTRDLTAWNALLAGFSSCGDNESVFRLFEGMQDAGFSPDGITFLCILKSCNYTGHVVKGKECFDAMSMTYGVVPTIKHFTCMIDLFGRANMFDDAMALLKCMPCSPDDVTWVTLLNASCKWENFEIGKLAFQSLKKHSFND